MERTTLFLHFTPAEELPQVGDTVEVESGLTHIIYQVTILSILGTQTLSDGRVQIKVRADKEQSS